MPEDRNVCLAMAMLAVRSGKGLNARDFATAWKACWPEEQEPTKFIKDKAALGFNVADCFVTLGAMPAPIPAGDIDNACVRSWMWPDARMVMAAQRAHVIVTVLAKDKTPVDASVVLTLVMAALVGAADPVGVYWGAAGLVIEPRSFVETAKEAFADRSLPLTLWVSILVSSERNRTSVTTHGLAALGYKEFEVLDSKVSPSEALEFVGALCGYVTENDPVLKHGETIGFTAKQKIKMEHRISKFTPGLEVIRLNL